jgi:phospholipid/cholesterol/gamma-HCH transport system substrate-binding protein
MSTLAAGLLAIVAILVFTYLGFTKFANPFASPYTVHAMFANANGLRPNSFVRIAGVNVGTVQSVSTVPGCKVTATQQCNAADVTLVIQKQGLPLHDDATFAIRPRIFLEGNFFVDVHPGSPETTVANSGHTFPIQQTTEPVQTDQVLTSLQAGTRKNLQILLQQYGSAVKQAGASYNRSIQFWLPAYKYSAIVSHDALGIQPHDLSNWIAAQGPVAAAFDNNPRNLQSLITDFNTTANAFARQNVALENTVAALPKTLAAAIPAFNALNAAFPPLRTFARALIPGVKTTGPMVDASLPFITQLRLLVQPSELRGLTHDLVPTIPALASLTNATIPFMRDQVRPASSCVSNVILPWSHLTLNDPNFNASNGFPPHPAYVEAVDFLPGLAGESRDFDANGPYIRILGTGGTLTYSLSTPGQTPLIGQSLAPIQSEQPQLPPGGKAPPLQPKVPCETQAAITDLSAPTGGPIQQKSTNLSTPGAGLLQQSTGIVLARQARALANSQGLKFQLSNGAPPGAGK